FGTERVRGCRGDGRDVSGTVSLDQEDWLAAGTRRRGDAPEALALVEAALLLAPELLRDGGGDELEASRPRAQRSPATCELERRQLLLEEIPRHEELHLAGRFAAEVQVPQRHAHRSRAGRLRSRRPAPERLEEAGALGPGAARELRAGELAALGER